jgi:hypothetical protein
VRAPRRNFARLLVLCLAVAFLSIQLGGAWHVSRQVHARCAEHGEWIDVGRAGASAHAHHDRGPVADSAASSQEHDHCLIVEATRVRATSCQGDPVELERELLEIVAPLRAAEPLDVGFARFLLAPKQSPPC